MASQIKINSQSLTHLANKMDELSHRAQDVLTRYEHQVLDGQSSNMLVGIAGTTNVSTAAEVKEAQMKIQARFQAVNDMLRHGANVYDNSDQDNNSTIHSVGQSLKFT